MKEETNWWSGVANTVTFFIKPLKGFGNHKIEKLDK